MARSVAGDEIPYDLALLTTGIVPHELYTKSGLETAQDGALTTTARPHDHEHAAAGNSKIQPVLDDSVAVADTQPDGIVGLGQSAATNRRS